MAIPAPASLEAADRPIRRAVRRFRWFKRSFQEQADAISGASGTRYAVRSDRLARVFVGWLRSFEEQRPEADVARRDYVSFASGLMLRHLVREQPLRVLSVPVGADASNPAYYWPEGYVYVAYCLNIRAAVLAQDFDETVDLAPDFSDIRAWWTFKENSAEDPTLAIAFLDLFAGGAPNWTDPGAFYRRLERPALSVQSLLGPSKDERA